MISVKGHIRILREGKEPLNLTEYSSSGFPEFTFESWDKFVEWAKQREVEVERGEVQMAL